MMRVAITPHGKFLKRWETWRSIFALLACIGNPITIISGDKMSGWSYFLRFLDVTAWIDIYLKHHIIFYNSIGLEISHPIETAQHYWVHGFLIDFVGSFPFDVLIPFISGEQLGFRETTYLRLNRTLQYFTVHRFLQHLIAKSAKKTLIVLQHFLLVIVLLNLITSIVVNERCKFDIIKTEYDDIFEDRVYCRKDSFLYLSDGFQLPLSAERIYAYGFYFMSMLSVAQPADGFIVTSSTETIAFTVLIIFWNFVIISATAKVVSRVMYRNFNLVVFQHSMQSLVKFLNYRRIDPRLCTEVYIIFLAGYCYMKTNNISNFRLFITLIIYGK